MNQNPPPYPPPDPQYDTIPMHPQQPAPDQYQSIRVPQQRRRLFGHPRQAPQPPPYYPPQRPARAQSGCCSCFTTLMVIGLAGFLLVAAYFLAPIRTNLLVLGIDRVPDGTALGRSDTMILVSVVPLQPKVAMLSIPRDLWVTIPGVGENRINTAHFYAEANQTGSGPQAALQVVEDSFDVRVPYYVRVRFDAFLGIVNALGGVTISLPNDMGGLSAGSHRLNGDQALAFVRDRKGTDDFFRMEQGQVLFRAVARELLSPASWPRLPQVIAAGFQSIDTNLPFWEWPRLGLAVVRAGPDGIDSRSIQREMVTPFTTDSGAQVLLPDWMSISALVDEMFR